MNRIEVHCHFLPSLDDGCQSVKESLACLRMMVDHGYDRIFCTPHCGAAEFSDLSVGEVAERVRALEGHIAAAGIPMALKPGGELRLSPHLAEDLPEETGGRGVPTYGHAKKYVLTDLWDEQWLPWATRAVEWLQKRGLTVIIAHPERMPMVRARPEFMNELVALGVLFQGNLGPLSGADSEDIVALSRRFLVEGRYFMVGSDGHRPTHLVQRLSGLKVVEQLVGPEKLNELTVLNPGRLWS